MTIDELRLEIAKYLDLEENLSKDDKRKYLNNVCNQFFLKNSLTYQITHKDFTDIVSGGKKHFLDRSAWVRISRKHISQSDISLLCIIEACIRFFNAKSLLTQNIEIQYTDDTYDFETVED